MSSPFQKGVGVMFLERGVLYLARRWEVSLLVHLRVAHAHEVGNEVVLGLLCGRQKVLNCKDSCKVQDVLLICIEMTHH